MKWNVLKKWAFFFIAKIISKNEKIGLTNSI